jgi:hypothetical protein
MIGIDPRNPRSRDRRLIHCTMSGADDDDSWHGRVGRMRCQIYESHYQKSGNATRYRESPKKNQNKVLYLNFQPIIIF